MSNLINGSHDDVDKHNKLATVLKYSGALAAEEHLSEIANREGDDAIMLIAKRLTPAEVAQVTSEADLIKPSILHTAITPEQFLGVFKRVGIKWGAAAEVDCSPETIIGFQDELQQFFCAFILLSDDEQRRVELLKVILDSEIGLDALVISVVHEKDMMHFIDSGETITGDWREIIGFLKSHFPESWPNFVRRAVVSGGATVDIAYTHEIAANLYGMAVKESGGIVRKEEEADELFTPLP